MNGDIAHIASQLLDLAAKLLKSAPAILGWVIIARLAYDRVKAWRQPIPPIEAAYSMAALAAFAYAIR
jgi:hypothetical protein